MTNKRLVVFSRTQQRIAGSEIEPGFSNLSILNLTVSQLKHVLEFIQYIKYFNFNTTIKIACF